MAKINILISPVGYKSEDESITDNVTEVIDIESVPLEVLGRKGVSEKSIHVKPDYVYLLLTKDSEKNAKTIKEKYPDRVFLCPDSDERYNPEDEEYLDKYDYKKCVDKLLALKMDIDAKYREKNITYFINITPGTKIISAAFASVAAIFNAYVWYVKNEKWCKPDERKYELFSPPTMFDASKLKGARKKRVIRILSRLKEGPKTRAELSNDEDSSAVITYNIKLLIEDGLVEELDPTIRKNSKLYITPTGMSILAYLKPTRVKLESTATAGNDGVQKDAKSIGTKNNGVKIKPMGPTIIS